MQWYPISLHVIHSFLFCVSVRWTSSLQSGTAPFSCLRHGVVLWAGHTMLSYRCVCLCVYAGWRFCVVFEMISQYSINHFAHSQSHANCDIKETNTAESRVYIQLQLITTQCHQEEESCRCASADMKGFSNKWNAYRSSSVRHSFFMKGTGRTLGLQMWR